MEMTKHGHACVVLSEDDRRLVIDPGGFTDPSVLQGASAVLVTHEHADHFAPDVLGAAMDADPALEVWTNPSVAGRLDGAARSEEHTSELQSRQYLVCRLLLERKITPALRPYRHHLPITL